MKSDIVLKKMLFAASLVMLLLRPPSAFAEPPVVPGTSEIRLMDAVRMAVEKNSTVKIYKSQQTIAAAGELSAKAQFDPQLKASAARSSQYTALSDLQKSYYGRIGSDVTKLRQGTLTYTAGYDKRYRSGISISPSVTVSTSESNDPQNRVPLSNGTVQFALIKPLARGKDAGVNEAYEKTARIDSESASLDSLYAVSQAARSAVTAYWNYAYSYKALKITEESKMRAEKLYNDTKTLVESSEVAPAELDQLTASLNQKQADCERAAQSLLQSKNELKLAIGVKNDSSFVIGPPADFFPVDRIVNGTVEIGALTKKLIALAMMNRNDYQAARKRLEAFKYKLPAARDALKPQIDLQVATGYTGRKDDKGASAIISSLYNSVPGTNVSATVSYSFPLDNKAARADVIRQEEQFSQAAINAEEIARQININIETRVNAVSSIISRYRRMIESGRLYDKALENEKEKNRMGVSTLMDVINLEDRLGQARLSLESAVLEYASAVADLRFESGCLGTFGTAECEIKMEDVMALPEVNNFEK